MRRTRTVLARVASAGVVACALLCAEDRVRAQGALISVIVQSESNLCLAVVRPPGNRAAGSAEPQEGWRIVVEPCAGTRAQRFGQSVGDYDDFLYEPGLCLGQVAGSDLVELAPYRTSRPVIESGGRGLDGQPIELRLGHGDLCLTAPPPGGGSRDVTLAACGSRPGQRWTMSRTR